MLRTGVRKAAERTTLVCRGEVQSGDINGGGLRSCKPGGEHGTRELGESLVPTWFKLIF